MNVAVISLSHTINDLNLRTSKSSHISLYGFTFCTALAAMQNDVGQIQEDEERWLRAAQITNFYSLRFLLRCLRLSKILFSMHCTRWLPFFCCVNISQPLFSVAFSSTYQVRINSLSQLIIFPRMRADCFFALSGFTCSAYFASKLYCLAFDNVAAFSWFFAVAWRRDIFKLSFCRSKCNSGQCRFSCRSLSLSN